MRLSWIAAAVMVLAVAGNASAQYPPTTPENYYMNRPIAQPWSGGGFDARIGYWIHGGFSDQAGDQWAIRAYTPVNANGYWLSQPPNTGFVMGAPAATAPSVPGLASPRCHPCRR